MSKNKMCKICEMYSADYKRNNSGGYTLRFLYILRTSQYVKSRIVKLFCKLILRRYRLKYGL